MKAFAAAVLLIMTSPADAAPRPAVEHIGNHGFTLSAFKILVNKWGFNVFVNS